jgi:homoserine kinase
MGRLIALKDIKKVCCKVPATSANLGSGFDIFGLSLPLYNKYVAYINPELKKPTIIVRGLGKGIIETNEVNLVYQSIKTAAKYLKLKINLKQIVLDLSYAIPLCGGLGSSSTAVVGGIILACKLGNKQITKDQLFNLASKLEGHPDNVAPCIYGGICSCFKDAKNTFQYLPLNYKKNLKIVINCPINFQLKTAKARAILPQSYSRADLVHSIERVTLFINALNNDHRH